MHYSITTVLFAVYSDIDNGKIYERGSPDGCYATGLEADRR